MGCARSFFDPDTGESTGFWSGSGIVPCAVCAAVADHLCDYPMGKGKTCSAPLCDAHAIKVEPLRTNRLHVAVEEASEDVEWVEFCPQHFAIFKGKRRPRGAAATA
jgi:hypothetical protein